MLLEIHLLERAVAGLATGLWRLEQYVLPLIRWRDKGIGEKRLEVLIDEPDYEWLIIDASHCKSACGRCKRRQFRYESHKRDSTPR